MSIVANYNEFLMLDYAQLDVHSFPTRRSSDLAARGGPGPSRKEGHPRHLPRLDRDLQERNRIRFRRSRSRRGRRSEEHTSELQSHSDLVCRLLFEKTTNSATQKVNLSVT